MCSRQGRPSRIASETGDQNDPSMNWSPCAPHCAFGERTLDVGFDDDAAAAVVAVDGDDGDD